MTMSRRTAVSGLFGFTAMALGSKAQGGTFPPLVDKAILTVAGKIAVTNGDGEARFDRPMLEAMGIREFTTNTPWYDGPVTFAGVPMDTLMRAVGAEGDTAIATALNEYETKIPVSDFARFNVLLALKRDREYMPIRDKGPLFIVYPYDSMPELQSPKYYSRSAWQLARLTFI